MAKAPAPGETKRAVWPSPHDPCACHAKYPLLLFLKAKGSGAPTSVPRNCVYPFLPAICISASQPCPTEPAKTLSSRVLARGCSDSSLPHSPFQMQAGFCATGDRNMLASVT